VCFGAQYLVFVAVESAGLKFGSGSYAAMYCALVCGISSTMIVVKLLSEKGETDRPNGRLTVGILIFQDIWAMVFLAIQPNLANPDLLTLCFSALQLLAQVMKLKSTM
jgi:Kef-type K+ transport system membrane component KefB